MHMGTMGTIGKFSGKNFKHVLFNNFSHESVGGQKTISKFINFRKLVTSLGYKNYFLSKNFKSTKRQMKMFLNKNGPSFFEIQVDKGSIEKLGRPKNLLEIKEKFLK